MSENQLFATILGLFSFAAGIGWTLLFLTSPESADVQTLVVFCLICAAMATGMLVAAFLLLPVEQVESDEGSAPATASESEGGAP